MEASPVASSSKVTLTQPAAAQIPKAKRRTRQKAKSGAGAEAQLVVASQSARLVAADAESGSDDADAVSTASEVGEEESSKRTISKRNGSVRKLSKLPLWPHDDLSQHENRRLPALWSADGRFYFKASGSAIAVHSANPPDYPIRSTLLESESTAPVVSYHLYPSNPLQLVVASSNGQVRVWDWPDGQLLRTIRLRPTFDREKGAGNAFLRGTAVGLEGPEVVLYAAMVDKQNASSIVVRQSLQKGRQGPPKPTTVKKLGGSIKFVSLSPSGRYLLVTTPKGLHLSDLAAPADQRKWLAFPTAHPVTSAVWCPSIASTGGTATAMQGREGDWFATGDSKGKIRLHHGLSEAFHNELALTAQGRLSGAKDYSGQLPSTVWHWHAHGVSALAFGSSGATLLSGGDENTLVKWSVETGQKDFLPRLGAGGIQSIAVKPVRRGGDQEEYWITLRNGSIVKNAAGTGIAVGVGRAARMDPVYKITLDHAVPLAYHAPTGSVVLPGAHPSTIQFYEPASQSVLFDLEIAPSNRVSRKEDTEIEPVRVERVAFCHDTNGRSAWMATSEGRDGDEREGGGKVRAVKLWRWDPKAKSYTLNTHIPNPHGFAEITSLVFCDPPSSIGSSSQSQAVFPYLLTTGSDGEAKLWSVKATSIVADKDKGKSKAPSSEMFWALRSTFSYRDLPIRAAAVSADNSLIALAHADVVTLWDTQSNIMLRTLERGVRNFAEVYFVGNSGRWVIARGAAQGVCAWDLLATEVAWSHFTVQAIRGLASSGFPYFIQLEGQQSEKGKASSRVTFLCPETGQVVATFRTPKDICHWAWAQDTSVSIDKVSQVQLVALDGAAGAFRLGSNVTSRKSTVSATHSGQNLDEQRRATIWEEMFGAGSLGESGLVETPSVDTSTTRITSAADKRGRYSSVFDGAAYTLPPVDLLLDKFLADFVGEEEMPPAALPVDADVTMTNVDVDANAAAREGRIFVDDTMILPPTQAATEIRPVPDEELASLTGWFKDLFSQPKAAQPPVPASASTPAPAKSSPNGNTSSLKKKNKHRSTPQAVATPSRSGGTKETPLPSPIVMPEFSAKKRKEKEVAAGSAAVPGQKRKIVPE